MPDPKTGRGRNNGPSETVLIAIILKMISDSILHQAVFSTLQRELSKNASIREHCPCPIGISHRGKHVAF